MRKADSRDLLSSVLLGWTDQLQGVRRLSRLRIAVRFAVSATTGLRTRFSDGAEARVEVAEVDMETDSIAVIGQAVGVEEATVVVAAEVAIEVATVTGTTVTVTPSGPVIDRRMEPSFVP